MCPLEQNELKSGYNERKIDYRLREEVQIKGKNPQ